MSSIEEYESLKHRGAWIDRLRYIQSLSDRTQIESHLKQSVSNDDLQMFLFLSSAHKNQSNLIEIFNTDKLPVRQRAKAAEAWLHFESDEAQIHQFVVNTINDKNIPRRIKHQILKSLHKECRSKKFSTSFYYNLACALTQSVDHDQFNIDAHTLPYCLTAEQITDLLSRWSLSRFDQIDTTSPLRSKLLRYQPLVAIGLIKNDLLSRYNEDAELGSYFRNNQELLVSLAQREPKAMCHFTIEHLNRLDKHKRLLPEFIYENQKRMFARAPDEMIELIGVAATYQPGTIKYQPSWYSSGRDISRFSFPRSFSIDHYVRLFFVLYDKCKWSFNHLPDILHLLLRLESKNIDAIRKQYKWFFEIVVQQRISKEEFLKKIFKQADESCLIPLANYPELSAPLARHFLAQLEREKVVNAARRLDFLRYEPMTSETFDRFLLLFKEIGSSVNQRTDSYPLLLQCAVSTRSDYVLNVLQWIAKRFTNEQLPVIEYFIGHLSDCDDRLHLQIVPKNLETFEELINTAFNHLQYTSNTIQIIADYAIMLLKRAEHDRNKDEQEKLHQFTCKIIKRCFSVGNKISLQHCLLSRSMSMARTLLADILVTDVFPKLISKGLIEELDHLLTRAFEDPWRLPQIDTFLVSFFFDHLRTSSRLQAVFKINERSSLIEMLLKQRTTRLERARQLINQISGIFLLDANVQQIIVQSEQHRSLIDRLVQNNISVTVDQLTDEESQLVMGLDSSTKNVKMPGLRVEVLNVCYNKLTGEQQEHIIKIILNDYLKDKEVSNLNKLKALSVIRRITHTYQYTLQWIKERQELSTSPLTTKTSRVHCIRGADAQSIDDIIICLPASFDLPQEDLIKHFDLLKTQLNASNAKYVSNAMLAISRKLPDRIFLQMYLDFVRSDQFQKLGITANKEILRLLVQYKNEPSLIDTVIQPLWLTRPHQDVRACLIAALLYFLEKSGNDETSPIWLIFDQAAHDDYLPVIHALFVRTVGEPQWVLTRLANSGNVLFRKFVERIQFRVLDHPSNLEAKVHAWSRVDYEHCDATKLFDKAKKLCVRFDKDAITCCEGAFRAVISCFKQQRPTSNILVDLVKLIMARREEVDSAQNAIDAEHDLPVYHRVHRLVDLLASQTEELSTDGEESLRTIADLALQFDSTLAPLVGQILIGLAKNQEDLYAVLIYLQNNLLDAYCQRVISDLGLQLGEKDRFCPFVEQLSVFDKFELVQWFVREKQQEAFVLDLFTKKILEVTSIDREQCRILLRQIRRSSNMYARQRALAYTITWKEDRTLNDGVKISIPDSSEMP